MRKEQQEDNQREEGRDVLGRGVGSRTDPEVRMHFGMLERQMSNPSIWTVCAWGGRGWRSVRKVTHII